MIAGPQAAGDGGYGSRGATMGSLDGRVAIVTGAGRGLGREHALLFAAEGARVVVNDTGADAGGRGDDPSPAERVVEEIRAAGGEAVASADDVADWKGGERLVQTAVEHFGGLDVLVNNAGILRDRFLVNMTEEEWDVVIHVHLRGHFVPMRHAAAYWRDQAKRGQPVAAYHHHLVHVGPARQPGPDQLRSRQGRHRRHDRHRRPGAGPLRRP